MSLRVDYCLEKAVEAKAQAAIFYINEYDYAQTWDYPDQKKALEAKGVPTLCFDMQKYLLPSSDEDQLKVRVEEFVEMIRTRSLQG